MERGAFARLGRLAVRRRWIVIGVWVAVLAVMGSFAGGLQDRLSSGGFEVPGSDSLAVNRAIESRFSGQFPATALVVVSNPAATVQDPGYRSALAGIASRLRDTAGVGAVRSFLDGGGPAFVSPDGHTTYLVAGLRGNQNQTLKAAARVSAAARRDVPAGFSTSRPAA